MSDQYSAMEAEKYCKTCSAVDVNQLSISTFIYFTYFLKDTKVANEIIMR